ncbi:MAG: hypothetical protein K2Y32_11645 [Candidatus Obscuribacterales bacterium]|nr:hypothetical protein [Candidatus Obscuribacterales bacterium]
MSTVIFIVTMAVIVLMGAWWLKRERAKQKEELLAKGRIAQGSLEQVEEELRKVKPRAKRKRKRAVRGLDGQKIDLIEPDQLMLDNWLKRVTVLVNSLLQTVREHQQAKAEKSRLDERAEQLKSGPLSVQPRLCTSQEAAAQWLQAVRQACLDCRESSEQAQEAGAAADKVQRQVEDLLRELFHKKMEAEGWELYRAPESFHQSLSMVGILASEIDRGYHVFDSMKAEAADRKIKPSKPWPRPPAYEPPQLSETAEAELGKMAALIEEALSDLVAVLPRQPEATVLQNSYNAKAKEPEVEKPNRPLQDEIDSLLDTLDQWAKELYGAEQKAAAMAVLIGGRLDAMQERLSQVHDGLSDLEDHVVTRQQSIERHALNTAHMLLSWQASGIRSALSALLKTRATVKNKGETTAQDPAQSRAEREALTSLRNNMRKACFAFAQLKTAQQAFERAKANRPALAEVVAPSLNQTSANAFLNTHARMSEITARNQLKTKQHGERVNEAQAQVNERSKLVQAALKSADAALKTAIDKNQDNADLAIAIKAAAQLLGKVLKD